MTDLTPVPELSPVPQLEVNTLALGGTGNPMNQQAQALVNRDAYRGEQIETAEISITDLEEFKSLITDPVTGAYHLPYSNRNIGIKLEENISVLDKGALGDGSANDADAFSAAASASPSISVPGPSKTYVIGTNLTLNADINISRGAVISVSSGVTLTINGHLSAPMSKIFSGSGSVVLGAKVGAAFPEWFGARDGTSTDGRAIAKCIAACRSNKVATVFTNNDYNAEAGFDGRIYVDSPVFSFPNAQINSTGAVNGFILEPGNYLGYKYTLPRMAQFSGESLKLRGANLANVELPSIQAGGDGIVFQAQAVDANTVLDSKVVCQVISAMSGNAVLVKGDNTSNVMQGNEVHVNFVTSCLRAVLFFAQSPAQPNWDGFKFVFQAIDPTPSVANAVGLACIADNAVPKCIFRVETWFGGFPNSTGILVSGAFNGLDFFANYNEDFTSYGKWALTGIGNRITTGFRGFDKQNAAKAMSTTSNARATWNSGQPIWSNDVYLQGTLIAAVNAGAQVTMYFYHPYANTQLFNLRPDSMNGFVVDSISTSANPNEIAVTLTNISGVTKAIGQLFKFFISVGN